jgi:hypothetical protein
MASNDDNDAPWTQQLLVGLGALAAISLLIGAIVSVVVLGAAKISGISSADASPTAQASLYVPPLASIAGEPAPASPNVTETPSPSSSSSSPTATATTKKPSPKPKSKAITLQVFPNDVKSGKRINFSGVYAREGATLHVQRFESGWVDFPATASVQGGIFQTFIYSGHTGLNRFRVYDAAKGKASNVVRVTIG